MPREPWQITREMFLSEGEVDLLLPHLAAAVRRAPADDFAPRVDELIVHSLLFSGLRNSEFCRLTLADTVIGTGESVFLVRGTPREDRTVFVPRELSRMVRRYISEVRPRCLVAGQSPKDVSLPLVANERGRAYERTGLYRRVVRVLGEAGLGARASVQLLRHTYGYLAYKRSEGNLLFVQRQLGHSHPAVTSIYAQFVDEPYSKLADAVGYPIARLAERARRPSRRSSRVSRTKGA